MAFEVLTRTPSLPMPGGGSTLARWQALSALGARDLCLVKLLEAHYDAQAILQELGGDPPRPGQLWAVWAAEPPGVTLEFAPQDHLSGHLSGEKAWCSGASRVSHALLTATHDGARLLCRMAMDRTRMDYDDSRWQAVGMARISSGTLRLRRAPAERVGAPGAYLARPGFWHGGAGIAACWHGGAVGVAQRLRRDARIGRNPHAAAHLGAVDVALAAASALLKDTARRIDQRPHDPHREAVTRLRACVAQVATEVVERTGRALGAGPLCTEGDHAQRCADLLTFIRQSHAETDLQWLGEAAARREDCPWTL